MNKRPVYLNLMRLSLPIMGWVSILHRISGVLLFLSFPATIYLLQCSLDGEEAYGRVMTVVQNPVVRFVILVGITSLAHHVFAGLRHLAIDVHVGTESTEARLSARMVLGASILVALITAWRLFL